MSYQLISYSVENGIATITINRPDKMNALNIALLGELDNANGVFIKVISESQTQFTPAAKLVNSTQSYFCFTIFTVTVSLSFTACKK